MTGIYLDDEPLGEVKRMTIQPDDVIVVECAPRISADMAARIREIVEHVFAGHDILILENGAKLSTLRPTDAADLPLATGGIVTGTGLMLVGE